jgi:hypothetical protein
MRIIGQWLACEDGITRPTLRAEVETSDGTLQPDDFLIDSGADRTVFSGSLLKRLGFDPTPAPDGLTLQGISGDCAFYVVKTILVLTRDDGGLVHMRGELAAFAELETVDLSVLGRDVFNLFDLILSRRRNEVLLLASDHQYRVEPT